MRSTDSIPSSAGAAEGDSEKVAPLKILLIAGGCCHDYATQTKLLKAGIESRIQAEVTVDYNPDTTTGAKYKSYESDDWAKGYDLILHDECSANVTDPAYVKRILDAHRDGVPAVNVHCAMHSYRWGNFKEAVKLGGDNAAWYEMIGIQSTGHGPKLPIDITFEKEAHPITAGLEDWTTINEELYNNVQIFDTATALASGKQVQLPKKKKNEAAATGPGKEVTAVVAWTNEFGPKKTRIFSTSIGHFNETVADDRYLDMVTRGLLWATGHLTEDGKIAEGYAK
jgi:type 1 glutamine amidotransferase